ncbi:MAG: glycosyltransferase [Sedimentisphaerales bacterium]|jgi:UDP-N-acetylglucosamine transferase subunit ALG13|nr:glycosyltransferase [Planctomycetota bacterium]MDY0357923.1 glycosyltransferase [Sedimentisphaerales bacterium]
MIFLTVGAQSSFDRLVRAVDDFFDTHDLNDEVFAQIGNSGYKPRNFDAVASLDATTFDRRFGQASAIVSHAGMEKITLACEHGKPLLAMPRLKRLGEIVDDHEAALADEFEALGHILVAHKASELAAKLTRLKSFSPQPRTASPGVVAERIRCFVRSIERRK